MGNPSLWFGGDGVLPLRSLAILTGAGEQTVYRASLFVIGETPAVVWSLWGLGLVSAIAMTVGFGGRIAVAVAWGMVLSAVHRIPMLTGLSEPVLTMGMVYLLIGPSTARHSLDARLRRKRLGYDPRVEPSTAATISLNLIRLHLVFFYAVMATTQMRHATWWDGEALWTMIASTETRWIDLTSLGASPFLVNALTHGIVAFELLFVLLIWRPALRPLLLAASLPFWVLIGTVSGLFGFALTMGLLGVAFLPPSKNPGAAA